MMNSFYLTLPSNSSMNIYPENTTATYKIHLPRRVMLSDDFEVALLELHYPQTLQNMQNEFIRSNGEIIAVPDGIYFNDQQFFHRLNDDKMFAVSSKGLISAKKGVKLTPGLSTMLGFEPVRTTIEAFNHPNFNLGLPKTLFVYTDIIEPQYVGDVMARLLRSVPINIREYVYGNQVVESFHNPQYVPIAKHSFQEIEIAIKDGQGKPAPFESGSSAVVLHFKKS